MAAMVGFSSWLTSTLNQPMGSMALRRLSSSTAPGTGFPWARAISISVSAPVQKPRPAPVRTRTRTSSSRRTRSTAKEKEASIRPVIALSFSGLSKVIVAM